MYLSRLFSVRCYKNLEEKNDQLEINYSGKLRHAGGSTLRDKKGPRRFSSESGCCQIYIYASGNRDGIGSHKVLKKISCERNLRARRFVNTIQSLEHLSARFKIKKCILSTLRRRLVPTFSDTYNRYLSTQLSSRCGLTPTCASVPWAHTVLCVVVSH